MGRKKKTDITENKLVKELSSVEFVKQPYLYAMIGADFTLVQRSIMIEIIHSLQGRFNAFLKNKRIESDGQYSLMFDDDGGGLKTFIIDTASIGVKPDAYQELEEACDNLLNMKVYYPQFDKATGTMRSMRANLFSSISIPFKENLDYKYKNKKNRRMNYVEVEMSVKTLNYLCDLGNGFGYMDHIYRIARISKRKRTPSIYIYLARWKEFGKKTVNYVELKKYLGVILPVTETDDKGKKVEVDKDSYPKFSMFCKYVMDPIKEELDNLAESDMVDFTFDYEPVYRNNRKKGDPEEILFRIRRSRLGEEISKKRKKLKVPSDVWDMLRAEYKLTDTDIHLLSDLLPEDLVNEFRSEVLALRDRISRYSVKNPKSYVMTSLKNFITQYTPQAEEVKELPTSEETVEVEKPALTDEDMNRWTAFMELLKGSVPEHLYTTWLQFMTLEGAGEEQLQVAVPTRYVSEYIEQHLKEPLTQALAAVYGDKVGIFYTAKQ